MTDKIYIPKGGMCKTCTKFNDDCSSLDFESMKPIHSNGTGDVVSVRCNEYDRKNSPKLKSVDFNVLSEYDIDCEFSDDECDWISGKLSHINICHVEPNYWDHGPDGGECWAFMRPRLNYWFSENNWSSMQIECLMNKLVDAGFRVNRDFKQRCFMIDGLVDGRCMPWEIK